MCTRRDALSRGSCSVGRLSGGQSCPVRVCPSFMAPTHLLELSVSEINHRRGVIAGANTPLS